MQASAHSSKAAIGYLRSILGANSGYWANDIGMRRSYNGANILIDKQ